MKVDILQLDIKWLDPNENIEIISSHLESQKEKIDLLVLPEMYLSGFCMNPMLSAVDEKGKEIQKLIGLCKQYDVGIIGSVAIRESGNFFNRVLLLNKEGILDRYDKQYLYSPSGESEVFSIKYPSKHFEFNGWKILPQVCYDLRFPENVRNLEAPELLIYMANWPTPRIHHWEALLRARAIENQCFTIGCNRIGQDNNNWNYPGSSLLANPDGTVMKFHANQISSTFELNKKIVEKYRSKYAFLRDKK